MRQSKKSEKKLAPYADPCLSARPKLVPSDAHKFGGTVRLSALAFAFDAKSTKQSRAESIVTDALR
jgi:hypothetical protein